MATPEETAKNADILFCPFCRDGFEGVSECPEHELILVPLDRLPRDRASEVTFFVDPRFGRGALSFGVLLVLAGFFGPFVRARGVDASALEVAIDGAHNLWLTPGAALWLTWILWKRRARRLLRSARVAAAGLALAGALPLFYTFRRISVMAEVDGVDLQWDWGLPVMAAGLLVALLASVRLGGPRVSGSD
jgi:hypothetical protein